MAGFKAATDDPQTLEYKIGKIFSELDNKIKSGYNLREILDYADELPFRSSKDKHELSHHSDDLAKAQHRRGCARDSQHRATAPD